MVGASRDLVSASGATFDALAREACGSVSAATVSTKVDCVLAVAVSSPAREADGSVAQLLFLQRWIVFLQGRLLFLGSRGPAQKIVA